MFSNKKRESSCLMAVVPWTVADDVRRAALSIPDDQLFHEEAKGYVEEGDSGREMNTHITVLYGIESDDPDDVSVYLSSIDCNVGELGWFHHPELGYHVLRYSVESFPLMQLNKLLTHRLPNHQTFPEYIPHITVAYVKDGSDLNKIEAAVKIIAKGIEGQRFVVSEYELSTRDGATYDLLQGSLGKIASSLVFESMTARIASTIFVSSENDPEGEYIAVDFDGTLAEYDGWQGAEHVGKPIIPMLRRVLDWLTHGKEVKIMTARASDPVAVEAIKMWCLQYLGQELEVTNVKTPGMKELWDDKAIGVVENTGERQDGIKSL